MQWRVQPDITCGHIIGQGQRLDNHYIMQISLEEICFGVTTNDQDFNITLIIWWNNSFIGQCSSVFSGDYAVSSVRPMS